MKLTTIEGGRFKLDGGAMFGVVPKTLWNRLNPADENNLCPWALRCLLIETEDRKILVDTSIGNKQDDKFRSFFHPENTDLEKALKQKGHRAEDITDVFITHFHFDHVGGAVKRDENGQLAPTFPKATYWSNRRHYDWAYSPNPREKASFLKENFVPLMEAGVLQFIEVPEKGLVDWLPGLQVEFCYGHTEAMMLLHLQTEQGKMVYCADLMPSSFHFGLPYVMSYDIRPLLTLEEKKRLLDKAAEEGWILYFEHDPHTELCTITKDPRGRYKLKQSGKIADGQWVLEDQS